MQKILIICADKDLRKDISKCVAKNFNCLYVDANDILDYEILNNEGATLQDSSQLLKKLERKTFDRFLGFDNCVVTISRDLFISNDNFKLLEGFFKVFISLTKAHFIARRSNTDSYRLEQELIMYDKINLLVNNHSDLEIAKDVKSIEEIGKDIISNMEK